MKEGLIYQIRWLGEFPYEPDRVFGLAIRLVGIVRPTCQNGWADYPILADRFRPIVERKTSISIFTKMLKTEHADV